MLVMSVMLPIISRIRLVVGLSKVEPIAGRMNNFQYQICCESWNLKAYWHPFTFRPSENSRHICYFSLKIFRLVLAKDLEILWAFHYAQQDHQITMHVEWVQHEALHIPLIILN